LTLLDAHDEARANAARQFTVSGAHPPQVPFTLCVGITGHRHEALPPDYLAGLPELIRETLEMLMRGAVAVQAGAADCFAAEDPHFVFVSALADGADQIAAEAALALGFSLQVALPFARGNYRRDFTRAGAAERFDTLIGKAERVLELPGTRDQEAEGYMMAGRATVAHCDVLIAIWDGLPARGRGGTAEIVELAIKRGSPVIHLPVDGVTPTRIVWSAFDPMVVTEGLQATAERPFDPPHVEQTLAAELLPPTNPQERTFLKQFAHERRRSYRMRIEYPLLLAVTGVKRFRPGNFRDSHCAAQIAEEWQGYREVNVDADGVQNTVDLLRDAYSWSDRLAGHFAQTYRSGHVFNFVLGGIAVCIGLSGFMAPHASLQLALFEFIITLCIILNTKMGVRNQWHRRWLDYRQLAERLRPMRSLKLLGIAAPDPPGSVTNPVSARWIDWYAGRIWEIAPQVSYHHRSAGQIDLLDQRLEKVAGWMFNATLLVSVAVIAGYAFAPYIVREFNSWFQLVSSGFPALGTAVFGIRFQGDFGGSAVRSEATANMLGQIDAELMRGVNLPRAADLTEQAARGMLEDLDEWRLVNQQQDLGMA
jgi:hypothetical protein